MRNSIWFMLAAALVLAACGSDEPEDVPTPAPIILPTPATIEAPPSLPPALIPVPRSPLQPFVATPPSPDLTLIRQTAADSPEPTPTAEPNETSLANSQDEVRTLYAPDPSTPVPAPPTPVIVEHTLAPSPPAPMPEILAPTESRRILLSTLGQSWESAQDITLVDILAVFETGYILVTGKTPEQDGWSPLILSDGEYIEFVTTRHPDDPGFQRATSYCCEETDEGLQTVSNADSSPGTVLTGLAHEAGHALQRIRNPSQNRHPRDSNVGAIREAEAYAFEAALMRALGVHSNLNVSTLLIGPETDEYIDRWRTRWTDKENDLRFEHERGFLILWLVALADISAGGAAEQIASQSRMLESETLFRLHRTLVALQPRDVEGYVDSLMADLSDSLNVIIGTISIRASQMGSHGSVEDSHASYVVP